MIIRKYKDSDEKAWVKCRVLAFLDCAYFDDVKREKEHYENTSIELVAEEDGQIVGLIDVECEKEIGTVCSKGGGVGAMIWHIAVLPEYRGKGIATSLLKKAVEQVKTMDINRVEAWTRDDKWVNDWYKNRGFKLKESYLHVYASAEECGHVAKGKIEKMYLCDTFCHYVGNDKEEIKKKFKRVHECNCYEMIL